MSAPRNIKPQGGPLVARRNQLVAGEMSLRLTAQKNTPLLQRLIREMPKNADKIAFKWANRMMQYAKDLAPRSRTSGNTNNPHDDELRDLMYVVPATGYGQGQARYRVGNSATYSPLVRFGARAHTIEARQSGVAVRLRKLKKTSNYLSRVQGNIGGKRRVNSALEHPTYERKIKRKNGRVSYETVNRNLSGKQEAALDRRIARSADLDDRLDELDHDIDQAKRKLKRKGNRLLVFRWAAAKPLKTKTGMTSGLFIGPRVSHPGIRRPNDFLAKARGRVGSPFAADIRRMLEGRY